MSHKIITIFLLIFLLSRSLVFAATAPYPQPPSQETLDKLREMGRQNELKYSTGGSVATKPKVVPTVKPNSTPTLTPTPIVPKPSPVVINSHKISDLPKLILWLIQLFFDVTLTNPSNLSTQSTVTPSPSDTPTPSITANQLWQKGFTIWVNTKDYAQASSYYQQALKINPDHVPTLASYGYILGAFYNRFSDGEAMLKRAMALDPTWSYAPYNLGLLYDISGKREQGIYWLQYTVDHFPNDPDIDWFKSHLQVAKEWKY